jgi:putative oxidoreductase
MTAAEFPEQSSLIKSKNFWPKLLSEACRWILAGVFLWSGIAKAIHPADFLISVESFQILPHHWAWLVSLWLPYFEITCAAGLIRGGNWARTASLLITCLLTIFIIVQASAWWRGLTVDCGCFGVKNELPIQLAIIRNMVLLLLASVLSHI